MTFGVSQVSIGFCGNPLVVFLQVLLCQILQIPLAKIGAKQPEILSKTVDEIHRIIHKTVAAVSNDLDKFHFNKAIARIRELTNTLDGLDENKAGADWVLRQGFETIVCLVNRYDKPSR